MSQAPVVYTGRRGEQALPSHLGKGGRLLALGIALVCLGLLVRAATITPSPTGVGTHRAMGLSPCGFQVSTGLPCPSCGMTTSFAWFVRGNLLASFFIQPMGMVLAVAAASTVWIGIYVAITGRPIYRLLRLVPGRFVVVASVGAAIAAWGWKIFIQLNHLDGWN